MCETVTVSIKAEMEDKATITVKIGKDKSGCEVNNLHRSVRTSVCARNEQNVPSTVFFEFVQRCFPKKYPPMDANVSPIPTEITPAVRTNIESK